jgi:hypothetical protein
MLHDERYFEAAGLSALYNCDIHEEVVENRMPLLSFMYICVASPIWRRLLRSLVAFALSRTLLKAGTTSAAKMAMVAITMSNSITVKARSTGGGELSAMDWD